MRPMQGLHVGIESIASFELLPLSLSLQAAMGAAMTLISHSVEISHSLEIPAKNIVMEVHTCILRMYIHAYSVITYICT